MKRDLESIILTRQELQIMKVVWKLGSATVKEVQAAMCEEKPTAYTTVLTLMSILEAKGALTHSRSGRAYVFRPLLSRWQATHNQLEDILARFFEGDTEKLIEYVLENEIKGPEQMKNIRSLLERGGENQVA
ncbi:MAG: BlaI/MecI/CopY family transcriptional regulator [Acidobacteriota bacterium]|jgi:predicted transcriptional regulator|nr:BlaI/MecI/CopY family transcriptional regulator [Acidobacteriota bacterium]NLT34245.1 BlaI/MecI/CopY family transcriptional regulator [Acidobacteriota bacterium]